MDNIQSDLIKLANKIKKQFYFYPIISVFVGFFILSFVIFISIDNFQKSQLLILEKTLVNHEKQNVKKQIDHILFEIQEAKQNIKKQLYTNLTNKITEAQGIITRIINNNPFLEKKELKQLIIDNLSNIRFFNNRGYYFAYDNNKKLIMHTNQTFIGKQISAFKDNEGNSAIDTHLEIKNSKNKESFAQIYFIKPDMNHNKKYKKIIYLKYIPELDWVIGTGDYLIDIQKQIQEKILNKIKNIRYGNNGYLWVHNSNHKLLMHPYRLDYIGHNDKELKDKKGTYLVRKFIKQAKANPEGAYIQYYWHKSNTNIIEKKLSLVKYVKDWDWIIGAGIYIQDIQKNIDREKQKYQNHIYELYKNIILAFVALLLLVIIINYKLSKKREKEFQKYSDYLTNITVKLENDVNKRTFELKELNNTLKEKISFEVEKNRKHELKLLEQSKFTQMGEMISNIAHQWRQPLSIISTLSTGLELKIEHDLCKKEEFIKSLRQINHTTQDLSKTIDQFRDIVIEKAELKLFIIQEELYNTIAIMETSLQSKNISLINCIDKNITSTIKMVIGEFSQIITSIVDNSKFALIANNIQDKWIKISLNKENNNTIITISDNAGGIPNKLLSKIFNPYFTTKHQSQGTGIGLYICKKIINENMHGKIEASNTQDGAIFTITIPKYQINAD